jgi:hypothetical protein
MPKSKRFILNGLGKNPRKKRAASPFFQYRLLEKERNLLTENVPNNELTYAEPYAPNN